MGLDSYVHRVRKPKGLVNKIYTMQDIQDLGLSYFQNKDGYKDLEKELLPYCQTVKVQVNRINMDRIIEHYHLSSKAEIVYQDSKMLGVRDPEQEDETVCIENTTVRDVFTDTIEEDFFVFYAEEVLYWRKNFDISDFFHGLLGQVENCGYYELLPEYIEEYNQRALENGWEQLDEECSAEDAVLFYLEWY